jgi:putative FmdB family regulatory protein
MPTYDYKCSACGHAFEKFHSITAAPIRKCPKCGKNKVKRLVGTGGGLIFKGSGFYITDYRSEGYKSAAKSDSGATPAASDNGKASTPSTDAKPAAKAESTPAAPKPSPAPSPSPSKKK